MPDVVSWAEGSSARRARTSWRDPARRSRSSNGRSSPQALGPQHGLWVTPTAIAAPDGPGQPSRYLELVDESPIPTGSIRDRSGCSRSPSTRRRCAWRRAHDPYRAAGVEVEELGAEDVLGLSRRSRPGPRRLAVHHGHRLAPAALTVALALMAVERGAAVRHHLPVRALIEAGTGGRRRDGRRTDRADEVVVATGPWTPALLDPIGLRLPIAGARGWLVRLDPGGPAPPPRGLGGLGGGHRAVGGRRVRAGALEDCRRRPRRSCIRRPMDP